MIRTLRQLAHARSGDKGNSVNVAVFARTDEDYEIILAELTESEVRSHFKFFKPTKVTRYEVPNLNAVNFVLDGVLDGGGSISLRTDAQGKAFGQLILEMEI